MSWESVAREHELMPKTVDFDFWRSFLTQNPTVMHRLLADLHAAAATAQGKDPNRLPTVEELRSLVTEQYTNDPLAEAVKKLLDGRSVRWLAAQMKVHHSQVTRVLRGDRDLVRDTRSAMMQIEAIARVLRVHPSYFVEWRRLWILSLVDVAFEEQPNLSIGVWKRFSGQGARGGDGSARPTNTLGNGR